jgi:hypothetical protein
VVSIPQYGAPWRWSHAVAQLITPSGSCPPMTALDNYGQPAQFYSCTAKVMWRLHPQVLDETLSLGLSISGAAWILAAAGCALLVYAALRPTQDDLDPRSLSTSDLQE